MATSNPNPLFTTIAERLNALENQAMRRYAAAYDNELYLAATEDQGAAYCNAILDQAFVLCGSVYVRTNETLVQNAGPEVLRFWELFTQWKIEIDEANTPD